MIPVTDTRLDDCLAVFVKAYWKNFALGAIAALGFCFVLGYAIDKARGRGDASGALGEIWGYVVFIGIIYSLLRRPWRNT